MIGTNFLGRYLIEYELGHGGIGVVYSAHDNLLDRHVAIKVLSESTLGTQGRARLLHEAKAAARLNHPNIVSVYDAGTAEGQSFIIMERLEGDSLDVKRPGSIEEILSITRQICLALEHAHAHGIIHRDLKPENVIILPGGVVKLADFGLARSVASRLSTEGMIVGTVFYMPPEQALGKPIDLHADLYSLGIMLYELVAGRLPFYAEDPLTVISQHIYAPVVPPSTYNPAIPPDLESLILKLLSKDPLDRPASAAEVRKTAETVLHDLKAGKKAPAYPTSQELLSPLERLVRGRLVGRERELAEAKALWRAVLTGASSEHVLLISGEPGVGKTPLLREITALAEVTGARVLSGECYPDSSAPYAPLAEIIREAGPVALSALALADLVKIAPDLQNHYLDIPANPPLDPVSEQQRLFESMVAFCLTATENASLMMVIEDVHWADYGTLSLLRHLARRSRSSNPHISLLIVMTYRDVELDENHPLQEILFDLSRERLSVRIKLSRYDRDQTGTLLATMLQEEIEPAFLDAIYRETEGNQFFIEEICKSLIEEGKLYHTDGHWRQPANMNEIQLPQSIRMAIQSRLGKLSLNTQEALRLAALIGREFDFDTLLEVSEFSEDELVEALEEAERAQLIHETRRAGQEVLAFSHGLTMSALRESVSGLRRRRIHRRIAAVIEERKSDDYESLAFHYHQAGDQELARINYRKAAERAQKLYANPEALRFYSEALALTSDNDPERFDLLLKRADIYDSLTRRKEQYDDIQVMLELAEELDDDARRCDALIALSGYYIGTQMTRGREPAERAVALARLIQDPVREARALLRLGHDARNRSDLHASRMALTTAVERFKEAGLLVEAAASLHMLSLAMLDMGENNEALEAVQEALALSRQAGSRQEEAISLRRLAIVYMGNGDYTQALPYAQSALELIRLLGNRYEECHCLNVLGLVLTWLGDFEQAHANLSRLLEIAEEIMSIQSIIMATENLIWSHYRRLGEYEAGLHFLEPHLDYARSLGDAYLLGSLQADQAELLFRYGQYEPALLQLGALLEAIKKYDMPAMETKLLAYLSYLKAHLGDFPGARESFAQAFEMAKRIDHRDFLIALRSIQGGIAWLEGEPAEMRRAAELCLEGTRLLVNPDFVQDRGYLLEITARLYQALGEGAEALDCSSQVVAMAIYMPYIPEETYWTHSQALRLTGHVPEANEALSKAYQRVMMVASKTKNELYQQSWLENVPINRLILADWARYGMKE